MRSRFQLKHVTEFKKYLEEQMQLIEPVIWVMRNAVEKSKIWIEDKNDNPSITYIELCQELDSATTAMLGAALHIISENKDTLDVDAATPSIYQALLQTTATEKPDRTESTDQVTKQVEQTDEILSRLKQIETAILSLQDANDKSTDDISEIKQWRDNFVTEQSDMGVIIEQLTKKQKQNFKNLRKQMSEQDNKVKELNKEIESLKEKETKSNKTLGKLSLDMKQYEINVHKINKDMQDSSTQMEKYILMNKLLQQRLMPIDKLIQIFNQNLETREERTTKLENIEAAISKLSKDLNLIESRVCNRYACYVQLADSTPVTYGSIISTFGEVLEYNGQHFNQTTGTFVSPHDGLYLVCVSLHEWEDKQIGIGVWSGDKSHAFIDVKCADTSAAGSVVVNLKKGQELYLKVYNADQDAKLSYFSRFTIASL